MVTRAMVNERRLFDLYMAMRSALVRSVNGIVPPKDVEDIVQETYVRVFQISGAKEIRSPRSFMLRTARNLALDYAKRAETRLAYSMEDMDETIFSSDIDGTLEKVCVNEEFSIFCAAVRELPTQCRRAFVLKKVYGYTQREIAHEMQINEKTVEGHIGNGITRCKSFIVQQRRRTSNKLSSVNTNIVGRGDHS